MRQITVTTESGAATYPLATGAPAPTIKGGYLVFHTTSGVQSVPAGTVFDFTVSTAKRQTKEEKLAAQLAGLEAQVRFERLEVFRVARDLIAALGNADDAPFSAELDAYVGAVNALAALKVKADRFRERRAETQAKREAKAAETAATPEPKKPAKKTTKK